MQLVGDELVAELRAKQAEATFSLCQEFVEQYPQIVRAARIQSGTPTFYGKRGPEDSRLDPDKSMRDQFNLLRVVDNANYPAFLELDGVRYVLTIEKAIKVK